MELQMKTLDSEKVSRQDIQKQLVSQLLDDKNQNLFEALEKKLKVTQLVKYTKLNSDRQQ